MNITNLSKTPFTEVVDCFLAAFGNYYVTMPTDHSYYTARWKAAGVNFNLSYGMFDGEKLIAFIIHAVDYRVGKLTAFNTGTGVIPEYRGKRIVKSIYQYALDDLQKNGVERSTLEVITENDKAIRAYQSAGFNISTKYKCFAGEIQLECGDQIKLSEIALKDVNWENLPNQQYYSWDFQKETIMARKYSFYQVVYDGKPESFFIFSPETKYLAQFDLLNTGNLGWERLFSAIRQVSDNVKVINVDERLTDKLAIITASGLAISVEQYEMELIL